MPIFNKRSPWRRGDEEKNPLPSLPPPPEPQKPRPTPTFPLPHRHELLFHCQLAHGSSTKDIKDFASVKDLYGRVAEAFEIDSEEVNIHFSFISIAIVKVLVCACVHVLCVSVFCGLFTGTYCFSLLSHSLFYHPSLTHTYSHSTDYILHTEHTSGGYGTPTGWSDWTGRFHICSCKGTKKTCVSNKD